MAELSWDVVVIGAGAAGLMAAIHAAERGRRTLVLEKNRKAGVKILMSGGTRCNITQATDNRGIVAAYGAPGKFLHSALAALGPDIRRRNAEIFFSGVANQSYPVNRAIGGRWFDETLFGADEFERAGSFVPVKSHA